MAGPLKAAGLSWKRACIRQQGGLALPAAGSTCCDEPACWWRELFAGALAFLGWLVGWQQQQGLWRKGVDSETLSCFYDHRCLRVHGCGSSLGSMVSVGGTPDGARVGGCLFWHRAYHSFGHALGICACYTGLRLRYMCVWAQRMPILHVPILTAPDLSSMHSTCSSTCVYVARAACLCAACTHCFLPPHTQPHCWCAHPVFEP